MEFYKTVHSKSESSFLALGASAQVSMTHGPAMSASRLGGVQMAASLATRSF
jgi:hypothetical protein